MYDNVELGFYSLVLTSSHCIRENNVRGLIRLERLAGNSLAQFSNRGNRQGKLHSNNSHKGVLLT